MKISKLETSNFKGVSKAAFNPGQLNILCGPNGSGKTTLLEAVRGAVTGKLPEDALKMGTAKGFIMVDVPGLGTIRRNFGPGGNKTLMCGKTATAKAVGETLHDLYGSRDSMDIMFSSEVMEAMMGTEMAEYLLNEGFLKNDMTLDKILAMCKLSKPAQDELGMMLPAAPEVIQLSDIQEAHDICVECRKEKKRDLKETEVKAQYEGIAPTREFAEANQEQEEVAAELGKLSAAEANYISAKRLYDTHEESLRVLREKVEGYKDIKAPVPAAAEILKTKLNTNAELQREVAYSIQVNTGDIESLKKILDALGKPVCPISKELVCTTDKTGVGTELREQIAAKTDIIAVQCEKQTALRAESDGLVLQRAALDKQNADYQAKLLYKDRLSKEEAVKVTEPSKPDTERVKALKLQAEELREEVTTIMKYAGAMEAKNKLPLLKAQVDIYEELVDQLSPKGGVRQQVLAHSVTPLQAYCNAKMAKVCPKFDLVLDTSEGFRVLLVDKESGESILYRSASEGEQLRVAYVLMSMFNALNQFRILVLDNLNRLDVASCQLLLQLVKDDMGDYDHVFLASANNSIIDAAESSGLKYVDVMARI